MSGSSLLLQDAAAEKVWHDVTELVWHLVLSPSTAEFWRRLGRQHDPGILSSKTTHEARHW